MSNENEDHYSIKHPVVSYAFAILEYVKNTDSELFKRAQQYAEDLTGVELQDFTLEESDSEEDELDEINDEFLDGSSEEDNDGFSDYSEN